jgi:hypothetical protein
MYMGEGSDDLENYSTIMELMLHINTKLKFKQETAALEQQDNNKLNQQSNKLKSNSGSNNGESKGFKGLFPRED